MPDCIIGCMGLGGHWDEAATPDAAQVDVAEALLNAAVDAGLTAFDHADLYKYGRAESVFGAALARSAITRDSILLQSKCGIRWSDASGPKRYDWSAEWISASVEGSLRRLRTDYLDTLLLHRPDPLMALDEVAGALEQLLRDGKVRQIGVSNLSGAQIQFLRTALPAPIAVNQIELHLLRSDAFDEVVTTGQPQAAGVHFAPGTLEVCREHRISVQCWGSLCQGWLSGRSLEDAAPNVVAAAKEVARIAKRESQPAEAIVLAWLMRHPMGLVPVTGTTSPERIARCARAREVTLSREDWYALWVAARGAELP